MAFDLPSDNQGGYNVSPLFTDVIKTHCCLPDMLMAQKLVLKVDETGMLVTIICDVVWNTDCDTDTVCDTDIVITEY